MRKLLIACAVLLLSGGTAYAEKCGISINGKCYNVPKGAHEIKADSKGITVDGKPIEDFQKNPAKIINVTVNAPVESINDANSVIVTGAVAKIHSNTGEIHVNGNVSAGVSSSTGDIQISGYVTGDVHSSTGDINAKQINGNITTSTGNVCCTTLKQR